VLRGVGGHADDVEPFAANHLAPVGVSSAAGALLEALPPPWVAAAAGRQLDALVAGQRGEVGAVEVRDALAQRIAGNLVASADEAEADDAGAVGDLRHAASSRSKPTPVSHDVPPGT